jgi:hypothetical protein
MLQNNMADRGRASKDVWSGGWLPVCASQSWRRGRGRIVRCSLLCGRHMQSLEGR